MQIIQGNENNLDVVLAIFEQARGQMTYLPQLHTHEETKNFILELLKSGSTFIAQEEAIMGFVTIENGWVEHLYVSPQYQDHGVGKKLLDKAKELSPGGLKLWVFEENSGAIRFYEREGFKLIKKRNKEEQDNEEGQPDRLYQLG
jgi:ribosomal protein S18 acetylase RimI-like enzyme